MKLQFILPELIRNLFHKPTTTQYPFAESKPAAGYRGVPVFDSSKCIGCQLCVKDCPCAALEIIQTTGFDNPKERKFKMKLYEDRCIHCGQCAFSCVPKAMTMNEKFETAGFERKGYVTEQE